MLTGDATVNPGAPVICCTAEVLANIALREGADADVGQVIMDEFHFYAEPGPRLGLAGAADRAAAGAVPADVGHARRRRPASRAACAAARGARPSSSTRPSARCRWASSWSTTPLEETLEDLVTADQAPAYVVHFTQAAAVAHATTLHARARSAAARPRRA